MRSIFSSLVLASAAVFATASAEAAIVTVPFTFTIAGQTCPSGNYSLDQDVTTRQVILRGKATTNSFRWALGPGAPAPTATGIALTFQHQDGTLALERIQYGPLTTSRLNKQLRGQEQGSTLKLQGD